VCLTLLSVNAIAQNPYVLNGGAYQDNCHCYTLTIEDTFASGSIWNKVKIDLTQPFDYHFNVNLGCLDLEGADGIVFVLQPVSTSLGSAGEGLGFDGIVPSLGVTIDTYQNYNDNDPSYDHLALQMNGDVHHYSPNNLAGPVTALANSNNIEDCKWHVLRINWQPFDTLLEVSMDGALRLSLKKDIIGSIFQNDPLVYWGFTSATGGRVNLQQICTSLDAAYVLAPHDNTCIGTPLTFIDSSISFGSIAKWYWDFGDGITDTVQNPPTHLYDSPGVYNVSLNVLGGEGCLSDTFKQQITVGTYPIADFKADLFPVCTNRNAIFTDESFLQVGTEDYWYWNFGNGDTSHLQNPPPQSYAVGNYTVRFFVESKEGCASDTVQKIFTVADAPTIDFTTSDACKDDPVLFTSKNFNDTVGVKLWYWNFSDGSFSLDSNPVHVYTTGGNYDVSLVAQGTNGCISDTITKPVTIYATNAFAGHDTTILMSYPYQLHAAGGDLYTWSPSTGLDNPFIQDPVATLTNDITYVLIASSALGCATADTLHLKVVKGPEIYVPSAFTPNGDGRNDRFKIIPVGITELSFTIVNRWGQIVYSSKNAGNGWDGTFKGVSQAPGTYVWTVQAKTIDNLVLNKQGTLVLIR
jgi:gliding motility-associated-like protein